MTFWDYRRQTLAVIPDACIFLALGMSFAFGFYNTGTHFRLSWYVGVIAGILLFVPLTKFVYKRYLVFLSSALVVVAAILNIAWPHDETATLAARYINGIGTGVIIVPFIVHCSETIITRKRGYALGLEQLCIAVGFFLQATYFELYKVANLYALSPPRVHGIFCLCFGLIALPTILLVLESPVYYICRNNDAAALHVLTKFELPAVLSEEKKQLMEEHKNYVFKNELLGLGDSFVQGLGPLFRMILYRIAVALTFSLPYASELAIASLYGVTSTGFQWPFILSLVFRILGVFGGMTMSDSIGRKILAFGALLVMGALGIGVAVFFHTADYYSLSMTALGVVCTLLVLMQFFAGLYAATSTIYLSEAFPMLVKPFFIAISICLEYAVHIALIFVFRYDLKAVSGFNIFTCSYLLVCALLFLFTLPETKLTTLTEAQERFRSWMHLRSW